MGEDEQTFVFCRACQSYFTQDDLATHDKLCTASKSVIKKLIGSRYDMVSESEVPEEFKRKLMEGSQSKGGLLESAMMQSKGKLMGILNTAKNLNRSFIRPKEDTMEFICIICNKILDQTEIGSHIEDCSPPEGFIGSQFMVYSDYLAQKEEEEQARQEAQVEVEKSAAEGEKKKKKRKHRHRDGDQSPAPDEEENAPEPVEEKKPAPEPEVAEPIYICTVCGKQLKASECAAHTKSCKQPKGMSGNQFFMIEPDEPETKPVEEKPVEEAPAAEGEKKKKKRKHHRTEEEKAAEAAASDMQPAAEEPVVEDTTSKVGSEDSSVDGEKKKKRKHRHREEKSPVPEEEENAAEPESKPEPEPEPVEEKKPAPEPEVAEPIYICTVCSKQLKASECAAHTKSCKQPKGMSGNQFFMIEPDEPETKPVEEKPVEEKPVEEAPAAEGEKKKKKRKHRHAEEEEEKAPEPEPEPQPVVEEPSSEPIFICQVCGKSFTQIECIDHINICKPPKSFSGSQFVMIEEDQPTVDTMEPIKASVPSSMDELAQKAKEEQEREEREREEKKKLEKQQILEEAKRRAKKTTLIDEDEKELEDVNEGVDRKASTQFITFMRPTREEEESSSSEEEEDHSLLDQLNQEEKEELVICNDDIEVDYKNPFDIRCRNEIKPSLYIPTEMIAQLQVNCQIVSTPTGADPVVSPIAKDSEPQELTKEDTLLLNEYAPNENALWNDDLNVAIESGLQTLQEQDEGSVPEESVEDKTTPEQKPTGQSLLEIAEERRRKEEEDYKKMLEQQRKAKEEKERREKELAEQKEKERLDEIKRKHEAETAKKAGIMKSQKDYILFSSLMEVGCNCMKHCSNGEYHSTILKLKTFSDILKNSISWQRKKGAFKSREGSILISTIQDVVPDGPRKCILTNNKRSYQFEFYTKEEQQTFVFGLKSYLDYYKQQVSTLAA